MHVYFNEYNIIFYSYYFIFLLTLSIFLVNYLIKYNIIYRIMILKGAIFGEAISKSPLNHSKSKQLYSFSKEPRFRFYKNHM